MTKLEEISEIVKKGRARIISDAIDEAIKDGSTPNEILSALMDGMSVIGEKFKNNEVYVPEVLISARAMSTGIELLKPLLSDSDSAKKGKACIGTVKGDLHDIGKKLVKIMLESHGIEVIDLGVDVTAEQFINTAITEQCDIICCSALLTTTMVNMKEIVELATKSGIRSKVAILIGGAPVNEEFCKEIGADKYTSDAASAADAAVKYIQSKQV